MMAQFAFRLSNSLDLLRILPVTSHVAGASRTWATTSMGMTTHDANCQTNRPQAVMKFILCPCRGSPSDSEPCRLANAPAQTTHTEPAAAVAGLPARDP